MWDVFISHASEDKDKIAAPLADELQRRGLRIWYDDFSLELGDSLRRSIDAGLAQSRFGVIILSPQFFTKHWPQRELDGLTSREVSGKKVILPVWHGVTHTDVAAHSPLLADRLAVSTDQSIAQVADAIERAVRRGGSAAETPPRARARIRVHDSRPINLFLLALCFVAVLALAIVLVITRRPGAATTELPNPPRAGTTHATAPPRAFEAVGRIRFSDNRPAEGVEVSIPLLRLSVRTNAHGNFYLGQIDVPGTDSLDLQIAIKDTVFQRRIALNGASLDIVLPYMPPAEVPSPVPPVEVPLNEPRPGPSGPASREPKAEPEPKTRPVPMTGSVVEHVDGAVGGQQFKYWPVNITGSGACRLSGRVQVLRGGHRNIDIVVIPEDEFEDYKAEGDYVEVFRERDVSDYTLDVGLSGPRRYYLVLSNRRTWLIPKYVLVENVRWACMEDGT